MDAIQGSLQRDVSKLRHEQAETKEMAARALTNTDQAKHQIAQLTQRVTALENKSQQGGGGEQGTIPTHRTLERLGTIRWGDPRET